MAATGMDSNEHTYVCGDLSTTSVSCVRGQHRALLKEQFVLGITA